MGASMSDKIPEEFSQWVRRWSLTDPKPRPKEDKDALRDEIQAQTEAFLAKGGEVKQVDTKDCYYHNHPVKLTRKEQIKYNKKFLKTTHCKKTD